jgi:DNA-binding FrmR family transcriptional regulator
MEVAHKHTSHPRILARLKRAQGHLKSVIAMIEAERDCLDLAQQLHAVEAAVGATKRELIHDHIDHCLGPSADTAVAASTLQELKALTKYL